jgi:hypothetical protein
MKANWAARLGLTAFNIKMPPEREREREREGGTIEPLLVSTSTTRTRNRKGGNAFPLSFFSFGIDIECTIYTSLVYTHTTVILHFT